MAFVRAIVLACAVAGAAAFNPSVGAYGRVGSLRKSVAYAPAAKAPKLSSRKAAATKLNMAAKGYDLDLTGKVCSEGLNFFIPSWLCMC
jgi:hypothetical protein